MFWAWQPKRYRAQRRLRIAAAAGFASVYAETIAADLISRQPDEGRWIGRTNGDPDAIAAHDVAVDDVADAGQIKAERVIRERVGHDVIPIHPVDLQAVGIALEPVVGDHVVVSAKDFYALRRFWIGRCRSKHVVGDQI